MIEGLFSFPTVIRKQLNAPLLQERDPGYFAPGEAWVRERGDFMCSGRTGHGWETLFALLDSWFC